MNVTQKQQDEAARRELEARGYDHWTIAELDASWADHVARQRAMIEEQD